MTLLKVARFRWDSEHRAWLVTGEDHQIYAWKPSGSISDQFVSTAIKMAAQNGRPLLVNPTRWHDNGNWFWLDGSTRFAEEIEIEFAEAEKAEQRA